MSLKAIVQATSEKLEKYATLNKRLLKLMGQDGWTPATFALIMSGVAPVPGCIDIPESAAMLEDDTQSATSKEFRIASRLMEYWLESELDEDVNDASKRVALMSSERPTIDYLIWSLDYDLPLPSQRPRLLEYVLALWREPDYALQAAPSDIVDRAYALEYHAAIESERIKVGVVGLANPEDAVAQRPQEPERTIHTIKSPGRSAGIASVIAVARRRLGDELGADPRTVWAELVEMARNEAHPVLRGFDERAKVIRYVGPHGNATYSYDALAKLKQFKSKH